MVNYVLFEQGPLVAEALVLPFGATTPDKTTRDKFLSLLIGLYRDPRLLPGGWGPRMRKTETIVRRWLTEQSLRQFLDIVDRVAVERMWKYRRAFWEAVYNSEIIQEAWPIFDADGAEEARRAFGKQVTFGQFQRGGAKQIQRGHTVLLLRVGRGLVADWSHNGKCNIWNDAEAKGAPKLYNARYTSDEVQLGRKRG